MFNYIESFESLHKEQMKSLIKSRKSTKKEKGKMQKDIVKKKIRYCEIEYLNSIILLKIKEILLKQQERINIMRERLLKKRKIIIILRKRLLKRREKHLKIRKKLLK